MSDNPFWDEINEILDEGLRDMYAPEAYSYIDNDEEFEIAEEGLREFFNTIIERIDEKKTLKKMVKRSHDKFDEYHERYRVLTFTEYFFAADAVIRKTLKKFDKYSINKEAYKKIIAVKESHIDKIKKMLKITLEKFETDTIYGHAKDYLYTTKDYDRDYKIVWGLAEKSKNLENFFIELGLFSVLWIYPYRIEDDIQQLNSTEDIIITRDDIINLFLPDDSMEILNKINKYLKKMPKVIHASDDDDEFDYPDELYLKYKKYIEIYQPYKSVFINSHTFDNKLSPISAYCNYVNILTWMLETAIIRTTQYYEGIYLLLKYTNVIKEDGSTSNLLDEVYRSIKK